MKLVVGLRNPGEKYVATRHNVGAWFIDAIADNHQHFVQSKQAKVSCCDLSHNQYVTKLLLPDVYMNVCGAEIARYMRYYAIKPQQLLVAYDDLDFDPGQVRFKIGGGLGGHNGLKSLKNHLGSDDFMRL